MADDSNLDSNLLSPPRVVNGKERRNPSITPRKFKRFFTPRSRVPSRVSSARRALKDLAAPTLNHRYHTPAPSSPLGPVLEERGPDENLDVSSTRSSKRRKFRHTPDSSPCRPSSTFDPNHLALTPSANRRSGLLSPIRSLHSSQEHFESDTDDDSDGEFLFPLRPGRRIAPLPSHGLTGQLVQRQLGGMPRPGRSFMSFPTADWRVDTADFYTRPDDVHECVSHDGPGRCIPFCTATCHKSSITAVGDEEGRVRLLDSSGASEPFSKIHLCFQAHTNAIIDLSFSDDDYLLATASGDQTGRVIDMMTQSPVALLQHHTASLKQVRFQPGQANSSVLATSSRDGSVQIWDLRCAGRPVQDIGLPEEREVSLRFRRPLPKQGCAVNSLYHAHARTSRQVQQAPTVGPGDTPSHREIPGRIGDVSVTALQFLPAGQEHLLLTACEADASIKLWDIRSIHSSRQKVPSPLSVTTPPASHLHWRPFGISSLALSTDSSRLYALCKDNTVYAYSTAHLILGHAPELDTRNGRPRRRHNAVAHQGLGPLYGFRHPQFHATSFYVKCALRPARNGQSELLAVGSSDCCAVLFPTREQYFRDDLNNAIANPTLEHSTIATAQQPPPPSSLNASFSSTTSSTSSSFSSGDTLRPAPLFRPGSSATATGAGGGGGSSFSVRLQDDIPIVRAGTALVRGHGSEVGALAWTDGGALVTVGDDYFVRCWREDRSVAADLRTGGETGGRRWGCGWADVAEDWDEDEDDEE